MGKYTSLFQYEQWLTMFSNIVFTRTFAGDFTADNPCRSYYRQMMQANIPEEALLRDRTTQAIKRRQKSWTAAYPTRYLIPG